MKTGTKVLAGLGASVAVLGLVSAIALWSGANVEAEVDNLGSGKLPSLDTVWDLSEAQALAARAINALLVGKVKVSVARAQYEAAIARMPRAIERYEAIPHTPEAMALWKDAKARLEIWRHDADRLMPIIDERNALRDGGGDAAALARIDERMWPAYTELRGAFDPLDDALEALLAQTRKDAAAAAERAHATSKEAAWAVVLSLIVGGALLLALGAMLARQIGGAVATLVKEAGRLRAAVLAGKLDVRGDAEALDPEFRPIVEGINQTMDAFERPISVTAEYVVRISNGDIPPPITDRYEGDFNRIKDALNRCIEAVHRLVADADLLAKAGVEGRLSVRADASRHQGDFRRVVAGVNATLDAVVAPLTVAAGTVDAMARGEIPPRIEAQYQGDFDAIKRNLNTLISVLGALIGAMERLTRDGSAQDDVTVDVEAFRGLYRTMALATQEMATDRRAVRRAMDVVGEFSRGHFAASMERLSGKRAFISDTVEAVRTNLQALIQEADGLAAAAVEGKLQVRAAAERHPGDFSKVIQGINRTLDAVVAPVNEATEVLEQLSQRDLRARVTGRFQGDHARLTDALNLTAEALHGSIAQVAEAADQVSSAAAQIASSSQAVASGASQQASAIAQTGSSLDAVSSMVRQSSENAAAASGLAQGASGAASQGAVAVEQLQGVMGRIKQAAEGTSQIIRDVSDIAFQTNLLALNAAVESARAGEAGRGFAVVAEEVRSLALRAKEAATKTEELIRQSVREAGEGEVAAKQVASKLAEIVGGVSKVTDIVGEIAASSREQASGISQVSSAAAEMDKVTQQNAASAEESSSAASELSSQSEELAAMVASFQLDRGGAAPLRPAAALPRAGGQKRALHAGPAHRAPGAPAKANGCANGHAHGTAEQRFPLTNDVEVKDF